MCRGKAEGGRRCPCDTTEGRRERAKRAKLRKQYEGLSSSVRLVERPIIAIPESLVEETPEQRLERVTIEAREMFHKMRIEDANVNYSLLDPDNLEVIVPVRSDKFENIGLMGAKIHELAEAFNGGAFNESELEGQLTADERFLLTKIAKKLRRVKNYPIFKINDYKVWFKEGSTTELLEKIGAVEGDSSIEVSDKIKSLLIEEQNSFYSNRAECYRKALEAVGVELGGVELATVNKEVSKGLPKRVVEVIRRASRFIPRNWLEASNEAGGLFIKETDGRAHVARRVIDLGTDVSVAMNPVFDESLESLLRINRTTEEELFNDRSFRISYVAIDPKEIPDDGLVFHEPTGMRIDVSSLDLDRFATMSDGRKILNTGLNLSLKKRGEGIRKALDGTPYTVSRRSVRVVSELAISGLGEDAESTFYHEFCHRREIVNPDIVYLEGEFLRSRIADGERLQRIPNCKEGEVGYSDSFHKPYCGRIYLNRDGESRAYEIMSMGVEAVFYGDNGGFVGSTRDDEYRNFVLGVLVSTGNKDGVRGEPFVREPK